MTMAKFLPKDYEPFPKIVICGNTLINVRIPFEIEGEVPLLIGDDGKPRIWMNAAPPRPELDWQPVVRANRSLHEAAVVLGAGTEIVSVSVKGLDVLSLIIRSDKVPEVIGLDLRPLGLNIYGDTTKLMVGTNRWIGNTFQNVHVMIEIGESKGQTSD